MKRKERRGGRSRRRGEEEESRPERGQGMDEEAGGIEKKVKEGKRNWRAGWGERAEPQVRGGERLRR